MRQRGHSSDELVQQVGDSFGEMSLVAAGGSVVVGYGNDQSDVDVYAVGAIPDTQGVPLVSHELGPLLDITLINESSFRADLDALESEPWLFRPGSALAEKRRRKQRTLDHAIRIASGVILAAQPAWRRVQASLDAAFLAERAETWWHLEALRQLVSARWLGATNPRLTAQLCADARLSALKAVTARSGFLYLNRKWVSTELRALAREDLLAEYRQLMIDSWEATESALPRATRTLEQLLGDPPEDLLVEVSYLPGVSLHAVGGQTLVTRWEMRSVLLDVTGLPHVRRGRLAVWTGRLDEDPPTAVVELVRSGMAWLGVCDGSN
jgi:hypothetical protein